MQHKCFRHMSDILGDKDAYAEAYTTFLQSGHITPSLEHDMYWLLQHTEQTEVYFYSVCTNIYEPDLHFHYY